METYELTKLKPLSITLAVTEGGRIIETQVAEMKCKGRLAYLSATKYGMRVQNKRDAPEVLGSDETPRAAHDAPVDLYGLAEHTDFDPTRPQRKQVKKSNRRSRNPMTRISKTLSSLASSFS